ncbi:MAG: hypothetical protein DIZ78_15360 [endosymbiont of Escarpia spicata]|uniref:Glycosyltransferase RgtA/B/C/D-like domain-containing protein n=1 Tax=endosymbiont of Escarpia spicata TaxID=2200908 RepID=A0A370DEN0_9GAMM|nr:MAG: hypothetical protein DIZ78_15360 [endosymbiont of Escarpia spicata]
MMLQGQINQRKDLIHRTIFALLTASVVLFVSYYLFTPYYMTNDDISMRLNASGKYFAYDYGPNEYLLFINYLYGVVLKWLYSHYPTVHWYDLLFTVLNAIAMIVFMVVSQGRYHSYQIKLALFFFSLAFFPILFYQPQFTVTAVFLASSGLLVLAYLLAYTSGNRKWCYLGLVYFVVSVFIASLIRINSALLVMAFGMFLITSIAFRRYVGSTDNRILLSMIVSVLFLSAIVYAGVLANKDFYAKSPGHNVALKINKLRSGMQDNAIITLREGEREKIDSALSSATGDHWSLNDFLMFRSWMFANEEIFSLASIEKNNKIFFPIVSKKENLTESIKEVVAGLYRLHDQYYKYIIYLLVLAMVFSGGRLFNHSIYLLSAFALIFLIISFVIKIPPFRVYLGMYILMGGMVFVLKDYSSEEKGVLINTAARGLFIVLSMAMLIFGYVGNYIKSHNLERYIQDYDFVDDQHVYVFLAGLPSYTSLVLPFRSAKDLSSIKMVSIGWASKMPYVQDVLKEYGINNFEYSICTNDDVLISGSAERIERLVIFMREHYQKDVEILEYKKGEIFDLKRCTLK